MYADKRTPLDPHHHVVVLHVYDEPGVLTRITGLFNKRNFNIDTITVGKSAKEGISRITISFFGDDNVYEQLTKQLNKLIDVIKINDLSSDAAVIRELALITIATKKVQHQEQLKTYLEAYRAKPVSITRDDTVVEIVGTPDKVDAFIDLVRQFGVKEVARTGVTGIGRSSGERGQ
ncbi:acetolactate synthase small subunit [Candidatus Woesearchaeota archaeon]|nr:acetolactate synthase small subunit [Candidatus Woesearchaeota archaeon]